MKMSYPRGRSVWAKCPRSNRREMSDIRSNVCKYFRQDTVNVNHIGVVGMVGVGRVG